MIEFTYTVWNQFQLKVRENDGDELVYSYWLVESLSHVSLSGNNFLIGIKIYFWPKVDKFFKKKIMVNFTRVET